MRPDKKDISESSAGAYVPENAHALLTDLENQFEHLRKDKAFKKEFLGYLHEYAGRP
jgi:tryptophan synthase beta subunit